MKKQYRSKNSKALSLSSWALSLLILIITSLSLPGQSPPNPLEQLGLVYTMPDSILKKLESFHQKPQKATYLLEEIETYHEKNSPLALFLAKEAKTYLKGSSSPELVAQLRYWTAKVLSWNDPESEQLQIALTEALNARQEFVRTADSLWSAKSQNLVALIYYYQNQLNAANLEIDEVLNLVENKRSSPKWQEVKSEALRIKGNILLYNGSGIDSAMIYYLASEDLYKETGDSLKLATLYLNKAIALARLHASEGEYADPKPDYFYQAAIGIFLRNGELENISGAYLEYATYLADLALETQHKLDFIHSNNFLWEGLGLKSSRSCEFYFQLGVNYQNMAAFNQDENIDSKILLDTAAIYYQRTIERAVEEQNITYFRRATSNLERICPILKNARCREVIGSINTSYEEILDAVFQVKDTVMAKNLEYQDELAKREQRQILSWTGGGALGLIATISFIYYRSRLKNLNKALENKMEALRAQMNPHFISNSLNAIDSLINQERNDEASEYIIDFSRLCRLVLNHSKEKWITLEEELETLNYFIVLEKLRLGDNLTYSIEVDDELNQTDIRIPPMLLQPFVENAIWHGIQKKQAPGHLEVAVFKNDLGQLECHITDDGIGREKAQALQQESVLERQSWGMQITKERMDAVKKIQGSVLEITDLKPGDSMPGTKVSIQFPLLPH